MHADTTLATSVQVVDKLLRRVGIEPRALYARHGIDPALLAEPSARLPQLAVEEVLREAAHRVPDPAFGLLAAQCWHPTNLGALGHAWLASSSLRRGLERLRRYWQLLGLRTRLTLRDVPEGVMLVLENPRTEAAVAAVTTDIEFSVLLDMCRVNAGRDFAPVLVRLIRPAPDDPSPYERFFACPVLFGAPERALLLPRDRVDAPLPTSNRQLVGALERLLAEEIARIDRADVVARARALLLQRLSSGEATASRVARDLAMSRRTLHRKLAEADTTWVRLVDDTRRDLAMRLIEDPRRPIGEITFELGFSQQSAFARAFRRWAGTSPSGFRGGLHGARGAVAGDGAAAAGS